MKPKTKKFLILVLVILILSAAFTGWYLFNKPPVDVQSAESISVVSDRLYNEYLSDSLAAKTKFTGQVVSVSGVISTIAVNTLNKQVVSLTTDVESAYINCTLEMAVEAKPGQMVTIKGICTGIGQGDVDLGIPGDVYLIRCIIEKKEE